jgi:hypothetical protein
VERRCNYKTGVRSKREKLSYLKCALFKTLTDKGKTKKGQPNGSYRCQKEKLTKSGIMQNGALYRPRQWLRENKGNLHGKEA